MMGLETIDIVVLTALIAIPVATAMLVLSGLKTGAFWQWMESGRRLSGLMGRTAFWVALFALFAACMQFLGVVAWFILIFVAFEGARKVRASRQYGLLWLLTVSAEREMPLLGAVEAFAQERGGRFGRQARRLADLLRTGVPLPDAIDRCPGLLPRYAAPIIRVGYETGTLARALRKAALHQDRNEPVWMALQGKIAYVVLLPNFALGIVAFVFLKIIPSYEKIFADFGHIQLPALTRLLMAAGGGVVEYWYLFVPLFLLGPFCWFYLPIRYLGWTDWDFPGMGSVTRRLDSAEILDTLALVAERQQPFSQAVAVLAHAYPKKSIRLRLAQAASDMMVGDDWCESLRRYDLIRQPEAAILRAAQRAGNLPWAMREMADSIRRRLVYRAQAAVQLLFPAVVILLGLVVMFVVVALFLPVVAMISKLA